MDEDGLLEDPTVPPETPAPDPLQELACQEVHVLKTTIVETEGPTNTRVTGVLTPIKLRG